MIDYLLAEKPDLLAMSANEPGFFPGLLESQSFNEKIGRFDILFAAPAVELVAYDKDQFNHLLAAIDTAPNCELGESPFQFGWLVYLSYESAYLMEPKLEHLIQNSEQPLGIAIYCQGAVVHDHQFNTTRVFADSKPQLEAIIQKLSRSSFVPKYASEDFKVSEEPGDKFEQAVFKAKQLIQAGDIYQANLSRQYSCTAIEYVHPGTLFWNLRNSNPAPFAALLQCNQFAVVSSSPERLLNIKQQVIETRPIAGTRPRGDGVAADQALVKELIDTPKERAEHIMLIDLERNDIGKVCQTGSVEVDELMVIETYQHVHHIVSNIKGILNHDISVVDAIKALFPGGTITGCPKIRCMEVIHEIESRGRSAYTGSLGYINHDGQADLNILIRTFCVNGNQIKFNAGAGIVFDSVPAAELKETQHKAKGMINALLPQ